MKLSVMMITYNHERFIAQALESVLAQRVHFDHEIVVGEDYSTDRTREILVDYCNRYPGRIVPLLPDRNLGMMRNLEQTISACHGQYVAVIEGDDYWTSADKLQKQVKFLDAHPEYTICCHRARILEEDGAQPRLAELGAQETGTFPARDPGTYTIEDLLSENFIMSCTAVYRAAALGPFPEWLPSMGLGDWAVFALIAQSGPIYLMDDVMAAYRVHPGGIWSSQASSIRTRKCREMLSALDEHLGFEYHAAIQRTVSRLYQREAVLARGDGDKAQSIKLFFDSIRNGGWKVADLRETLSAIVLGPWHGMKITTQLAQLALGKFGYRLVRTDKACLSFRIERTCVKRALE